MYEHFYPRFLTRQNSANAVKYSVSRIYARFGGVAVHVEVATLLERVSNRKADSYVKLNVKMEEYYRIKDAEGGETNG